MAVDNPSYFSVTGPSGSNPTSSSDTRPRGFSNIFRRRRTVSKMGGGPSSASVGSASTTSTLTHVSGSGPSTPTEEMVPMLVRGQQCSRKNFRKLFRSTSANSNDESMRQFLQGFPRPSDVAPPSPYLPHRSHSHSERDRKRDCDRKRVLKSTSELLNDCVETNLGTCVVDGHRYTNIDVELDDESQTVIHLDNKDVRYYNLSSSVPNRRRHSIGTFLGKERIGSSNSILRGDPKEILGNVPPIPTEQRKYHRVYALTPQMRRRNRPTNLELTADDKTRTRSGTVSSHESDAYEDVIFVSSKESSTATLWVEYLTGWFEKINHQQGRPSPFKISHIPIEDSILPETKDRIQNSKLQIIIVCPILLRYALDHSDQASLITSYFVVDKVLAMMLGVHESHVTTDHKLSLTFYSQWRKFFVKDQDVTFVSEFLGAAISIIGSATCVNTLRNDKTSFSIHPKKVKVGQSRVLALLNDPLQPEDKVEVIVDRCGEAIEITSTKRRNPYAIQFSIPDRCLDVSMLVGVRILKNGSPLGVRQVKCESRLRELDQILRAHDNPLEFMCQTFGFNPGDRDQLDNWMVHAFQRNVPAHFNLLSNPQGLTHSKNHTSQDEYPTLLHFAARFGLEKLAWHLLECPGGDLACEMHNVADLTPADIAEHAGHNRLAHQLRGYMQMHEFTNMYSYLKVMSEGSHENMSGNEKATVAEAEKEETNEDYCSPRPLNESYCIPPAARPVELSSDANPLNVTSNGPITANHSIALTAQHNNDSMPAPPNNNLDSSLQGYLEMSPAGPKVSTSRPSSAGTTSLHRQDSLHSVRDESQFATGTVQRKKQPKPKDTCQDELIEIINDFKNKIFTIDEMERLVESWRNRNDVQQSFKDKQRQLNDMREEYERIQKKMKDQMKMPTPFDRIKKFFGKGKKDHLKSYNLQGKNGSAEHRPVSSLSLHSVSSSSSSCRMSTVSGCSGTSLGDSGTHSDIEDRRLQHSSGGLLSYEIPPTPKPLGRGFHSQNKYVPSPLSASNDFFSSQRTLVHDKEFSIAFTGVSNNLVNTNGIAKEPKTPDLLDTNEIADSQQSETAKSYANIEIADDVADPSGQNKCIPKEYINLNSSKQNTQSPTKLEDDKLVEEIGKDSDIGEDVTDFASKPVPDYMNVSPLNTNCKTELAPPVPPRSEYI